MTYRYTRVRISPKDITQQSRIGNITGTRNVGNLFHLRQLWAQSTVHTNDFIVDNSGAGQTIKSVAKLLPHFHRKAATTLIVESVNAIDAGALVIASEQKEILRILDLVGKEQTDNFQ